MAEYTIGSLCAGVGGLDLAVEDVFDAAPAWFSQYEPGKDGKPDRNQYAAQVLAKHWPDVPNLGDLTAIDWTSVEPVDILTAGFPCQDLSLAGKRAGMREGNRSGLWFHIAQAIETLRPPLVVIENVPGILSSEADGDVEPCPWCLGDLGGKRRPLRALGAVLADLARLGFDAEWCRLGAADVGAAHKRDRVFLIAWPADTAGPRLETRREGRSGGAVAADSEDVGHERDRQARHWGTRSAHCGLAAAHPDRVEPERRGGLGLLGGQAATEPREEGERERAGDALEHRGPVAADTQGLGRREGRTEPAGLLRGPDAPLGGGPDWGPYGPAIARWEHVMGRPAPVPTEPGKNGPRLSPRFVEWLVGLADGWVTDTGIPRNAQLKCLGNIAIPQQAAYAIRYLMTAATLLAHAADDDLNEGATRDRF